MNPETVSTREQSWTCGSLAVWVMPSAPLLLPHESVGIGDPRLMKTHELALPLRGCSVQESRPCNLPGQQSRAGPGGGGIDE